MELIETRYYNSSYLYNSMYAIYLATRTYLANEIFKAEKDRVIYASREFAFRQRINALTKNDDPSIDALDLPFMTFWRRDNWTQDDRISVQNATMAMGYLEEQLGYSKLRFMNMMTTVECAGFFARDDEAQIAYETLSWLKFPARQQFVIPDILEYKGNLISLPLQLEVQNLVFNPEAFNENTWLRENRLFPITFDLNLRSVIFDQKAQSPSSTLFPTDETLYITKKVALDFLSYKEDPMIDKDNYSLEVTATFTADPDLLGTFSGAAVGDSPPIITLEWDYSELVEELYQANVKIVCNGREPVYVAKNLKTYTYPDTANFTMDSTYYFSLWFFSLDGRITKYTTTVTTSAVDNFKLKGMIGYTF